MPTFPNTAKSAKQSLLLCEYNRGLLPIDVINKNYYIAMALLYETISHSYFKNLFFRFML